MATVSRFRLALISVFSIAFSLVVQVLAYADTISGDGNNTGGVEVLCSNFNRAITELCEGGKVGGASWHVYSTKSHVGPTLDNDLIMDGNVSVNNILQACSSAEYYVAYGWDGRVSYWNHTPVHYGPAARSGAIVEAKYHTDGSVGYDSLLSLASGGEIKNQRITQGAAERLYGGSIPSKVGYFCADIRSFQGQASVAYESQGEAKTESTGFVSENKDVSATTSCNETGGCNYRFFFDLERSAGSDDTNYYVEKKVSSGSWESVDGGSGSFNPGSNNQSAKVWETEETISVGSSACYRMHFYPLGGDSGSKRTVTACAHVVGDLNSSIELKAKRQNDEEYQDADEGTPLYVRPDETIGLKAIYTSRVQSVANLRPGLVTVDGVEGSNNNANGTVKERFDGLIGSEPGWNNAFSIKADNGGSLLGWNYDVGDSSEHTEILLDGYSVKNVDDVGKTIKFTALTNENNSTRTTPKSAHVSYDSDSDSFSVAVNKNQLEDSSFIAVPYNFINTTSVSDEKRIVYAGEQNSVSYSIQVNKKSNGLTFGEDYATIVKGAKHKLQIDETGSCTDWKDYGEVKEDVMLNVFGELDGGERIDKDSVDAIPDIKAGSTVCFRSAVYPATSGGDNNLDMNGDGEWAFSEGVLYTVAKRPSLQVWGGNIYSSGEIATSVAKKNKLSGYDDGLYIFGSWGELGIISNKEVSGLASGAGYAFDKGANNDSFCFVSTLSFANNNCSNGKTGSLKVSLGGLKSDKDFVLDKLTKTDNENTESFPGESEYTVDSGIVYVKNDGGKITIDNNIIYSGQYESLESMPKVVIYGENVDIKCNVTRIDALIIANGTVNTCSNGGDMNSFERSTPLIINGAVVANKLEANRTYGAGVGDKSGIPAEIINFDSSLYLWGGNSVDVDANPTLVNAYQRELSPRY